MTRRRRGDDRPEDAPISEPAAADNRQPVAPAAEVDGAEAGEAEALPDEATVDQEAESVEKKGARATDSDGVGKAAADEDTDVVSATVVEGSEPANSGVEPPAQLADIPAQCLTFTLAGDEYGVGILQIREIVESETLTKVPTTPPWIRGVMNLRGTVVPVVDLAAKFGLPETEVTKRTCFVIVEVDLKGELTLMGVMVDAVVRVLDLALEDVEEPPTFGTKVRVDYLLGVGKVDDNLVLLLDVDRVLSLDELLAVAAAPTAAADVEPQLDSGVSAIRSPVDAPEV